MAYLDITSVRVLPSDERTVKSRQQVVNDILATSTAENHMIGWFTHQQNWYDTNFSYSNILHNNSGELVAISSNSLQPDNTMKILCHFYVLKKYRSVYRGIHQTNIIADDVEYGLKHGINGLWYSFHTFDNRHQRYSNSQKRLLNGSKISEELMPFWKKFKYVGNVIYKNVEQEKFYMDLNYAK